MREEATYAIDNLPKLPIALRHQVDEWHLFVDGSYYKPTNNKDEAMSWSVVVVAQITLPVLTAFIADISAHSITQLELDDFGAHMPGNDISEAAAVHNALLWHFTHASPNVPCHIHYDSKAAGCAAEGLYNASPNIAPLKSVERHCPCHRGKRHKRDFYARALPHGTPSQRTS